MQGAQGTDNATWIDAGPASSAWRCRSLQLKQAPKREAALCGGLSRERRRKSSAMFIICQPANVAEMRI
jgi:hypothetical protein